MFLLDTNTVSEMRKGRNVPSAAPIIEWASQIDEAALYLSAITILELEIGVRLRERNDKVQGAILRHWLDAMVRPTFAGRILPVDEAVALCCAPYHVPDPAAERDAFIAATAHRHGLTVVTRNVDDFVRTGVAIINPWGPTPPTGKRS